MFKFNFHAQEDPGSTVVENTKETTNQCETIKCHESQEIALTQKSLDNLNLYRLNSTSFSVASKTLFHVIPGFYLKDIKYTQDIKKAEESHSDLIPGVYEGGAKVWECTIDLLNFLNDKEVDLCWEQKRVLDLGCGSGLLGIYAYMCGARTVHFQDYNADVLKHLTVPNVLLNTSLSMSNQNVELDILKDIVKFYSGDWKNYTKFTETNNRKFDIILTSETIYNPHNQQKLLDTFHAQLDVKGVVYVAAKTYYFGVGGGLRQFEDLIQKDHRFKSKVLWTADKGIGREILELTNL